MRVFSGILQAVRKIRRLLALMAAVYIGSCLAGWYLGSVQSVLALEIRLPIEQANTAMQGFFNSILHSFVPTPSIREFVVVPITYIILIIFSLALIQTFSATTLPGVIPLVGAGIIVVVSWIEGFAVGQFTLGPLAQELSYYVGLDYAAFMGNIVIAAIGLVGNVFAAAAGVNISLSSAHPRRYSTQRRLTAFSMAWKDAARVYVIVVVLYALCAVLEVTAPL